MKTQESSNKPSFVSNVCKAVVGLALVALACFLFYVGTTGSDDEVIHFIEPTADNTYIYDSVTGKEYYLNDSAMAVREAEQQRIKEETQKMYERKMEEIIRRREERAFGKTNEQ